jgi:hypothetical protein
MATMPLKEVEKVEILTVLDNTIDLSLASSGKVKRLPPGGAVPGSWFLDHKPGTRD